MALFDLFSKRQKRLRGEFPDVYQYDSIPQPLRVQIIHIVREALGINQDSYSAAYDCYRSIHDILCKEYGVFRLVERGFGEVHTYEGDVFKLLLESDDTERVLDIVELLYKYIHLKESNGFHRISETSKIDPNSAIQDLNSRFQEHGVGYQLVSGEAIRVDSNILHQSTVKPALHLLKDSKFKGANEEYLRAHEHYRHGRHKECLNECLKALESTLKSICASRGWACKPHDTAKRLISICFDGGLIPSYLETQFSTLRQNLESGIPTVRNKLGGHGQGLTPQSVPGYFAAYQLHMTATTIVFLVEADKAMR